MPDGRIKPTRPPALRQLKRAIEKQLIAVRMPGGVAAVAATTAGSTRPRRVADHRVEAGVRRGCPFASKKTSGNASSQ